MFSQELSLEILHRKEKKSELIDEVIEDKIYLVDKK